MSALESAGDIALPCVAICGGCNGVTFASPVCSLAFHEENVKCPVYGGVLNSGVFFMRCSTVCN